MLFTLLKDMSISFIQQFFILVLIKYRGRDKVTDVENAAELLKMTGQFCDKICIGATVFYSHGTHTHSHS